MLQTTRIVTAENILYYLFLLIVALVLENTIRNTPRSAELRKYVWTVDEVSSVVLLFLQSVVSRVHFIL